MSMYPYGYVYRITNKVNGKTYVGQRKLYKDSHWREYMGSGRLILNAIQKHGTSKFVKSLLTYADTFSDLNRLELEFIQAEKAAGKGQYNLYIGSGAGGDTFSRSPK